MKNKITLTYGENGSGKSLYYENKSMDTNYICLNYDIENWYDHSKKIISQKEYITKSIINEIQQREGNILSDEKNFGNIKCQNIKNFLEKINFSNSDDWYKFYTKNKKHISKYENESIDEIFNIWVEFDKYKKIIDNLSNVEFELLKIYSRFKFIKIDNIKEEKAKKIQDDIISIENEIKETIGSNEFLNELRKINYKNLDKIRSNNLNINKLVKIIKYKIISLENINIIFSLKKDLEKKIKKSLNFLDYSNEITNLKISNDGYSIEDIDLNKEKYSNGQKIIFILLELIDCFSMSKKTIILDDIFEKLDIKNMFILINKILDCYIEKNIDIEILTHDKNLIIIFDSILNQRSDINKNKIVKRKIILKNKKPNFIKSDLTFTFNEYNNNILKGFKNNKYDLNHLLFAKLFNRNKTSNNFIQVLNKQNSKYTINENISLEIYNFISENIFHYEPNVDIKNYPTINPYFNDGIFNESKNTVEIYEELINIFKKHNNTKYGINLYKVSKHLEKMLNYIKLEKEYYQSNNDEYNNMKSESLNSGKFFSKQKFYSNKGIYDQNKRNSIFHEFEHYLNFD